MHFTLQLGILQKNIPNFKSFLKNVLSGQKNVLSKSAQL